MKRLLTAVFSVFLAAVSLPGQAEYHSLCKAWAKERDGSFFNAYDRVARDYGDALREQSLWAEQLKQFDDENAEVWLKTQEIVDFFLLGANVTAKTVSLSMGLSGVKVDSSKTLDAVTKLKDGITLANSKSVEEAAYRLVGKKNNAIKRAFQSLSIIKALLDAKDRFKDRKEAIKLVQRTGKKLRQNLQYAERDYRRASKKMTDLNEFKNAMDGACHRIAEDARGCISKGVHESSLGKAHQVRNTCGRSVLYFWCYEGTGKQHRKPCGGSSFYRSHRVLEPGDSHENYYGAPANLPLRYGACYGSYYTAKFDGKGGYYCLDKSKKKR